EDAVREEIERSRDQMSFLAEASSVLASSLDYRKTLNKVARLAVPRLADWCSVDVLEDDEIRPVAVAHADPTMVEKARELRTRWPADPETDRGTTRVIQTGRPEIYSDITDDVLAQVAR